MTKYLQKYSKSAALSHDYTIFNNGGQMQTNAAQWKKKRKEEEVEGPCNAGAQTPNTKLAVSSWPEVIFRI